MNFGRRATEFLGKEAPVGYVAGLGRGGPTRGFTTGGDVVPLLPGEVSSAVTLASKSSKDPLLEEDDLATAEPDESGLLSSTGAWSAEDTEALRVYQAINNSVASRSKVTESAAPQTSFSAIQSDFFHLKRNLSTLSEADWLSIPEAGVHGRKRRPDLETSRERYLPVPDQLILSSISRGSSTTPQEGTETDIRQFGIARERTLNIQLDKARSSLSNASETATGCFTSIDRAGYLTGLASGTGCGSGLEAEVGNTHKSRAMYRAITASTPENASAWIAYVQLEIATNRLAEAKKIIAMACEKCPSSETVWLERVKLFSANKNEQKKIILEALQSVPASTTLWLLAADAQATSSEKISVFRRALTHNSKSLTIWKAFVEIQDDPEDARDALQSAIQHLPDSIELWLALARLTPYAEAKSVLNKARLSCPPSLDIWVAAAKLEENNNGQEVLLRSIMSKALQDLTAKAFPMSRELWLRSACECESAGSVKTAAAIVSAVFHYQLQGADEATCKRTWLNEVPFCTALGARLVPHFLYKEATRSLPHKKSIWRRSIFYARDFLSLSEFKTVCREAAAACPKCVVIWLAFAKHIWNSAESTDEACEILRQALQQIGNNCDLVILLAEILISALNYEEARLVLKSGRENTSKESQRCWMKSVILERNLGNLKDALSLVLEATAKFPEFDKLWLMRCQLMRRANEPEAQTRKAYSEALIQCKTCVALWKEAAEFEVEATPKHFVKARALLEKARASLPKSEELWYESVKMEITAGSAAGAKAILSKALQALPASGLLHSAAVSFESRVGRLPCAQNALRRCQNDPWASLSLAKVFWAERNFEKANQWFLRSESQFSNSNADFWPLFSIFANSFDKPELASQARAKFLSLSPAPKLGRVWTCVRKDPKNWRRSQEELFDLALHKLDAEISRDLFSLF